MTMDAEMLEVLISVVATLWPEPLTDDERDRWHRMIRPCWSSALDPDLVASVLRDLSDDPALGHTRPDVAAFRARYDEAVLTAEPSPAEGVDGPSSAGEAIEHLDRLRLLLGAQRVESSDVGSPQSRETARKVMRHEYSAGRETRATTPSRAPSRRTQRVGRGVPVLAKGRR